VGFVQIESWVEERASAVPDVLTRLLDQRWLRNGVALSVSLAVNTGLILALISLGKITPPSALQPAQASITTFDIASVTAQQEGASAAKVARAVATPSSQAKPTPVPPPPVEWSVTTLPPLAPAKNETPQPQATAPAPAQGLAVTGNGSGAGYDPYAFASYRKPDFTRLASAKAPPPALQPLPDAVARLTAALGSTSSGRSAVNLRAYVDPDGRVVRVELVSTATPQLARRLAKIAPGFLLCAADPARSADASLMVTLTV
jgi:hypothetical protein